MPRLALVSHSYKISLDMQVVNKNHKQICIKCIPNQYMLKGSDLFLKPRSFSLDALASLQMYCATVPQLHSCSPSFVWKCNFVVDLFETLLFAPL